MAEGSPHLARHLKVVRTKKSIFFHRAHSKIVAMSADAPSKDGVSSSLTVLDETHRFKNDALYDVMKYAGAAREQPLLVNITTAGYDRHSLCYRLHAKALAIKAGELIDTEFLGVVYAADPGDDFDDPRVWRKANPSMGSVLSERDFAKAHREAKEIPRLWNQFLRLRLNVWTEAAVRWLDPQKWDDLAGGVEDIAKLEGKKCYAALDLSSTKDLTCLCLVFPVDDLIWVIPYFFIPEESIDSRVKHDKVPYDLWIQSGHMIVTPGASTDHEAVREKLNELNEIYKIVKVGVDPWNAGHISNLLEKDRFEVLAVRQGFATMSDPSKELERLILNRKVRHDGNPVQHWCVANVAAVTDSKENVMPCKKASTERIDGVVAMIMGLALAIHSKPKPRPKFTLV